MCRAPVLVAIALIENGMDAISAVTFIRERRYVFAFNLFAGIVISSGAYAGVEQSMQYSCSILKPMNRRGKERSDALSASNLR